MPTNVILDTDIGTDVDDCLALALIVSSPELKLVGVTCVYGDTDLRARMVVKLLQMRGLSAVPVMAGVRKPLLNKRSVYWAGHEGEGLLTPADDHLPYSSEPAVDFILRMAHENPGQIHLIGIGPLTNIALALLRDPQLPLAHITLMGGVVRSIDRLDLPYAEHNIKCDPEAAHIVFSSAIPMTVVPLDLTTQVRITRAGVARIRSGGTPFHDAVATQLEHYPRIHSEGFTNMHDPLAVASIIDPTFIKTAPVHVDVELGGEYAVAATLMKSDSTSPVQVGISVDIARFEEFLVSRIESQPA